MLQLQTVTCMTLKPPRNRNSLVLIDAFFLMKPWVLV